MRLTGSGATFPFPLYSTWFKAFSAKQKSVSVDYQGKGSGAGIQDFTNRTVDFAASDAAMTDEQISKVPGGVQLLPMTAGEIVLGYNLPGNPKELKLPRDVYAGIFLGKITKWSDPKLTAANPGVKLPDLAITVVRRADSSGTTFVYEEREGGIQDLAEWYQAHQGDSTWARAAGAYVRMLSRPQLFIEGNHRTGALLMSYILVRDGLPPFVLSTDSAAAYFDPSTAVKDVDKNSPAMVFRLSRVTKQLAKLLREHCDSRHLIV
jgi:ABC-type phosphate transport system substrate-binding protein